MSTPKHTSAKKQKPARTGRQVTKAKIPAPHIVSDSPEVGGHGDSVLARAARALDLVDLNDYERAFLATCQQIYRAERGCNTPFEEFFTDLVGEVQFGRWPTPKDVERTFKDFADNFDGVRRASQRFLDHYPDPDMDLLFERGMRA